MLQVLHKYIRRYASTDLLVVFLLTVIVLLIYLPFLTASATTVFGDEPRYHVYQTMVMRHSLINFHQFGFWDQFVSAGASWLGHPGGPHFSPFSWLTILLFSNQYAAAKFLILSHAVVAVLSMYFLLRVLQLPRFAGAAVAVAFVANRYAITFAVNGWLEEFFGLYIIPLSVAFLLLAIRKRSALFAILGGLVVALHFFETTYYVFHYNVIILVVLTATFLVAAAFKAHRQRSSIWQSVRPILYVNVVYWSVFVGIAAIKVIPLLEFREISARLLTPLKDIETPDAIMSVPFYAERLSNMVAEHLASSTAHTTWLSQAANTAAIASAILAFCYAVVKRSLMYIAFALVLFVGSWGFFANAAPLDLYGFLYNYFPGFESNIFPFRFIIIIHFAFFVFAALGLRLLVTNKRFYALRVVGYLFALAMLLGSSTYTHAIFASIIPTLPKGVPKEKLLTTEVIDDRTATGLLQRLVQLVHAQQPNGRVYSTFLVDGGQITTVEMLDLQIPTVHHSYEPIVPTYAFNMLRNMDATDDLELTKKRFKIFSVLDTTYQAQGVQLFDYRGCDGLTLPITQVDASTSAVLSGDVCDFLRSRLTPVVLTSKGGIYKDNNVLPKFSLIPNAVLVVGDNRFKDFNGFLAKQLLFHPQLNEKAISVLTEKTDSIKNYKPDQLAVFKAIVFVDQENVEQNPRVKSLLDGYRAQGGTVLMIKGAWYEYENLQRRSQSIYRGQPAWKYTEQESVALDSIFTRIASQSSAASGNVTVKRFTPEFMEFTFTTDTPNTVFQVSDSYFPGWKATLDGKATPVYMADGLVKAVTVPSPGSHTVTLRYAPTSLAIGALITASTSLGIVGYCLRKRLRVILEKFSKRRHKAAK